MSTRAPFMNSAYSGYYHRDVPKENDELTHVGPNTPCGEYLRRFWQPAAYSDELTDLPKKLRILGEDLVVEHKVVRVGIQGQFLEQTAGVGAVPGVVFG